MRRASQHTSGERIDIDACTDLGVLCAIADIDFDLRNQGTD